MTSNRLAFLKPSSPPGTYRVTVDTRAGDRGLIVTIGGDGTAAVTPTSAADKPITAATFSFAVGCRGSIRTAEALIHSEPVRRIEKIAQLRDREERVVNAYRQNRLR